MGVVSGPADVNWSLRLSERLTGVEFRVADVQLDVDAATMIAEVARAPVSRSLRDAVLGVVEPNPSHEVVRAACWHAAKHGASGDLVDQSPGTATNPHLHPAEEVVTSILDHVEPTEGDDFREVMPALAAVLMEAAGRSVNVGPGRVVGSPGCSRSSAVCSRKAARRP